MRILTVSLRLPRAGEPATSRAGRLAPVSRQIESLRALGIKVDAIEIFGTPRLKYIFAILRLWAIASKYDLVHAHYGFCGWVARAQFSCPVVVSFMGSDLLGPRDPEGRVRLKGKVEVWSNRLLARLVDRVIVKSREMAERISTVTVDIVPNGVDLTMFRPMDKKEARRQLGWHPTKPYILFPGDPSDAVKGFELSRRVLQILQTRSMREIELGVLWGVEPETVPLYMNGADVLLMTSLAEGSPNVVKEALACNLPIVTVPVGDVEEILAGTDRGFVVARDPGRLALAVESALSNGRSVRGRECLLRRGLDLASVGQRVVNVYEAVLPSRISGRRTIARPLPTE